MIDPEYRRFWEGVTEGSVESLRGSQIATKRLFDDHACVLVTARTGQPFRDGRKRAWRDGEVINGPRRPAKRFSQTAERLPRTVISSDILESCRERREGARVHAAVFLETLAGMGSKLVEALSRPCHSDDWHVEVSAPGHRLECRVDLLRRQIARSAKENKCIRFEILHFRSSILGPMPLCDFPSVFRTDAASRAFRRLSLKIDSVARKFFRADVVIIRSCFAQDLV
jgi:hypothetical protein